jgi:N-acetylmuramoyl-L-alanine amidase
VLAFPRFPEVTLSSTTRSRAKAGNQLRSLLAALMLVSLAGMPAFGATAAAANNYWFSGTRLAFEHPQVRDGAFAVGTDDNGLARFLAKVGATVSYQPGQRFVIVEASDRRLITFTLGDTHFVVGTVTQAAAFAPYAEGSIAYLPFLDLARALYVDPVSDGETVVMQPQIAALDVRTENAVTVVTLRGASPLQFKRLSKADEDTISLAFLGTGSTLEPDRAVSDSPLRGVSITVGGTPKNPTTVVNFSVTPGGMHVLAPTDSPNSLTLAFAPAGVQLGGTAVPASGGAAVATVPLTVNDSHAASPLPTPPPGAYRGSFRTPAMPPATLPPYGDSTDSNAYPQTPLGPAPAATQTPTANALPSATITNFDTQSIDDGFNIRLSISGPVTYEWHRLSDDRWYVDFKPANLAIPAQEVPLSDPSIVSLRIKPFIGPNDHLATVRVAFTMPSPRGVSLVPTSDGMTIAIDSQDDSTMQIAGTGELVNGSIVAAVVPLPPVVAAPAPDAAEPAPWKFSGPSGVKNPKLIVIDPGHGGSDTGAEHNGLVEKDVNLDVARRLRGVLIARGWQVKMTRDSDIDVYQADDSAHDELQARDDIANSAGARLLVSVHTNAFTTSELSGTTTYYYTAASRPLAEAIHARLSQLPTADDGIRKENFYVIHHQNMPGVLVEMAFMSNPGDAKLLKSSAFLQSVAVGIADGIGDYTSGNQPVSTNSSNDSTDGN